MRRATCEIISHPFDMTLPIESHGEIDVRIYFAGKHPIKFETDSQHPFAKAAVDALLAEHLGKSFKVAPGAIIYLRALIPHHIVELARKPKQLELDAEADTGIRLECGKFYWRRDGRAVGPVERTPEQHPFAADFPYMIKQAEGCRTYLANGRNSTEREEPFDLIAEVPTLKLEVGKWYRRRDGEVVGPLLDEAPKGWKPLTKSHPFGGFSKDGFRTYTPDGFWAANTGTKFDLIAEVPAPVLVPETQPAVDATTLVGTPAREDIARLAETTQTVSPTEPLKDISALARQEGGNHYMGLKIKPAEYSHANKLGFIEGSVVKYVSRWREKGGIGDLKKARHLLDILIELEERV